MISYYECDDTCMSYLASRQLMLAINSYLTPLPVVGFYWRHSFIGDTSKYWRAWNSEQKEVSKGWLYAVKCLSNYVRRDKSLEEMTAGSAEERQRRNEGRGVEQGLTLDFNDDKLDLKGRQLALGLLWSSEHWTRLGRLTINSVDYGL